MDKVIVNYSDMKDGEFSPSGFKHLLVGMVAASICLPEATIVIHNTPNILETKILIEIINELNGYAAFSEGVLTISTKNMSTSELSDRLSNRIHGAIYFIPALVGRFGSMKFGKMGGCSLSEESEIGNRPILHMLQVMQKFGCQFTNEFGQFKVFTNSLNATVVDIMDFSDSFTILTGPLVSGATKTAILMALSVNEGQKTIIRHPYIKPDVVELLNFLEQLGFDISFSNDEIEISRGIKQIKNLLEIRLMDDICQVMTYITMAIYYDIEIKITNMDVSAVIRGMKEEFQLLKQMGVTLVFSDDKIVIPKGQKINYFHILVTSLGIYSDNQPLFALLGTKANGVSTIEEHVWKTRFLYARELIKMGFKLIISKNKLSIEPSNPHLKCCVSATDLRAAAVILIAAVKNTGYTTIEGLTHLERGYDNLIGDLIKLGASIQICSDEVPVCAM